VSRLWSIPGLPVLALAISACADKPAEPPPATEARHADPAAPQKAPAKINPSGKVSSISLEDFFVLHESGKAVVIDARPSFVYQFGHVPGAINIPKSRCAEAISKRDEEFRNATAAGKKIIVYCTGLTCPDARTVADHLAACGISASVFEGGWDAWQEAGMPVE
jgi:rhodanese-related sulfurtransferase